MSISPPRKSANKNGKITLMRKASTSATQTRGIGGREKKIKPKPITLSKLKFLEP